MVVVVFVVVGVFVVFVVFVDVLVEVEVEIVVVGTVPMDDVVEAGGMQNERSNRKWFSGR